MSYKIFKALSSQTRIKIIEVLGDKEMCACEIPTKVGKSQPNVSQQLKMLEKAGILKSRKAGKMILYSVKDKRVFDLLNMAKEMAKNE